MSKTEPLAFVEPVGGAITPATKCPPLPSAGVANGLAAVKHTATAWRILLIGGALVGGTAVVSVGIAAAVVLTRPDGPDPPEPIGGWTPWSQWSDCTATCGLSIRTRDRLCEGNTATCTGPSKQVEDCYDQSCPKIEYGIWSAWSGWSACSTSCGTTGTGVQKKTRECNREEGQQDCPGTDQFTRTCNNHNCPDCNRKCPGGGVMRRPECMRCFCLGNRFKGRVTTIYNLPMEGVRVSDSYLPNIALTHTDERGMFTIYGACNGTRLRFREPRYLDEHHTIGENGRSFALIKMEQYERLQIAVQPEHKARLNNQAVTFCCNVGPDRPREYYYEWFFNSRLISPYAYNLSNTLTLNRLSEADSGLYKCRASNDWYAVYSDDARLIVKRTPEEFCNPEPRPLREYLPAGCTYMGLNYIDKGKCGKNMCAQTTMPGGNKQCQDSVQYCCDALSYKETHVVCLGYFMKYYVIDQCGCTVCSKPKVTITGTVYDSESEDRLPFISIYNNGTMLARSDLNGSFSFTIEQSSRTVSVYAKDVWRNYAGAMRVVHIAPRHDGFMYVNLPMRRYGKGTIVSAGKDSVINIGNPENPLGKLIIPANSFYTFSGLPFRGDAAVSTILVDPREHTDFFHRSADLSYIEREGNVQKMQTLGMFAIKMRTKTGDLPLQVNGSVQLALDMNYYRAVNSKPQVSFIHPRFGVFERQVEMKGAAGSNIFDEKNTDEEIASKFTSSFANNNFVYGEIKLHPASEWLSFDTELEEMCHSKVRVFQDNTFGSSETFPGTDVTVVSLRWDGTVSDVSNFRTFTDRDDEQGHCIVHHCDTAAPTKNVQGYIMAEAPNTSPNPYFKRRSIIKTLMPALKRQLDWKGDKLENQLNYRAYPYENQIDGPRMVKVNLDFTQVERVGPFYQNTGENHDFRNWGYSEDCSYSTFNPKGTNFFPFYSKLKLSNEDKKCKDTKAIPVDEVRTSQSKEQNYKAWFSKSASGKFDVCYIKVLTSGVRKDQHLKATSFVGNVTYESIKPGKTIYGIDQTCVQDPPDGGLDEESVCLEFKHPGTITAGGPVGGEQADETLLKVSAKPVFYSSFARRCEVTAVRQCLEKKYGNKITKPTGYFRNRQFAMYVAEDKYGPDYGIYCSSVYEENSISEVRMQTYKKCMDGGGRRVWSPCEGKDSDDPHGLGWAIKMECDK